MQTENRFFDDFAKMLNGVAGTFAGMGREAEASAKERMREWIGGMDFVGDEFEAVKAMAAAARDEAEALRARIEKLEAGAGGGKKSPKIPTACPISIHSFVNSPTSDSLWLGCRTAIMRETTRSRPGNGHDDA